MKYSQKYTLVSFLTPLEVGAQFDMANWPVHITLADVFAIKLSANVEQELTDLLSRQSPITLSVSGDAILGVTEVVLFNEDSNLQYLHDTIVDILEQNDAKFNTPEFTREGFLPHSTIQGLNRLWPGDGFQVTTVSLIDMFPDGDWRKRRILNNFKLRGQSA